MEPQIVRARERTPDSAREFVEKETWGLSLDAGKPHHWRVQKHVEYQAQKKETIRRHLLYRSALVQHKWRNTSWRRQRKGNCFVKQLTLSEWVQCKKRCTTL